MDDYNEQDIIGLINRYHEAYDKRDIDAIARVVSNDESFIAYGTDEGETWHGWSEFRHVTEKFFHAVEEIRWERGKPKVRFSRDGSVAWFSEELAGHFMTPEDQHRCRIRFTGVAEKRGGDWVIVQLHRSVPVEGFTVPYLETHGVRFD